MSVVKQAETAHVPIAPGRTRYLAYSENLMMTVIDFRDGPTDKPDEPHAHPHEQVTYVVVGEVLFFLGDDATRLVAGDMVTIPSNVPHAVQLLADHVRMVDAFTPIRNEFL